MSLTSFSSQDSVSFLGAKAGLYSFLSGTAKPEKIIFYRQGLLRLSGNHCREETCVGPKDQQLEPSAVSVPGALSSRVDATDVRFSSSSAYRISPAAAHRLKLGGPVSRAAVGELNEQLDAAIVRKAVVTSADSGPNCTPDSVSFLEAKAGLHSLFSGTAKPERIIFYRQGLLRLSGNHCREETCVSLKD
ncbi:uncharacterized protein LOC144101628 [Amblyomma americanum]